jgi:hypothetical protein
LKPIPLAVAVRTRGERESQPFYPTSTSQLIFLGGLHHTTIMPPTPTAGAPAGSTSALQPNDIIAFRTGPTADQCLIGMVASTPCVEQPDGTTAVLVQPRPLILVPQQQQPSPRPQNKKLKSIKLVGQLVDRTNPAVATLIISPVPSPTVARPNAAANTVMTAEEMQEMQEQRLSLQADLDTSRARVKEIDDLLRQNTMKQKKASPPPPSPLVKQAPQQTSSGSTPRPRDSITPAAGFKSAEEAAKATDAAERELLLSRAGLRTVKAAAWTDLQRRTRRASAPSFVSLVEAAVALLHDPKVAVFDEAVQQGPTLAKRLAAVKSRDVTDGDRHRMQQCLDVCPTSNTVEKEHRTAAALHRWLSAMYRASQAHRALHDAQAAVAASRTSTGDAGVATAETAAAGAATAPSNSESPDPDADDVEALSSSAEVALRRERSDQLEYVQMAEEEIAAIDALIAEANTLAQPSSASSPDALQQTGSLQGNADGSTTIVPALTIPAALVVCVFAASEAPDMAACAATPRGTPVAFSLPAQHRLVAVVRASPPPPDSNRSSGRGIPMKREEPDDEGTYPRQPSSLPPTTTSSCRTSGKVVSPRPSSAKAPAPTTESAAAVDRVPGIPPVASSSSAPQQQSEAQWEEKARLLEARLSAALQHNPKEAELQLLRDEVSAKRAELQRVTEERDRLLLERRERSMWGAYGTAVRRANGAGTGATDNNNSSADDKRGGSPSARQQHGSGRQPQVSTPRDMVDRSIVEELEEQLTAAHQRISELQIEASQTRRGPSVAMAAINAPESPVPQSSPLFGDEEEASSKASPAPPAQPLARTVPQELYDEIESRVQSVSAELEAQRRNTQKLEEQLNSALHRRTEAESVVAAQKRELEELWERLEAAEARVEERNLLTEQKLLMAQAQQAASAQQQQQQQQGQSQNAVASSASTAGATHVSPQPAPPLASSGLPRPPAQSTASTSQQETFTGFVIPSTGDAEVKSQPNDDAATVVNTAYSNNLRLSFDGAPRSTSAEAFPVFGAASLPGLSSDPLFQGGGYGRGASASLQSRPVEQLSTIELRHEVHRLREEVERHQSGELRLSLDLQTLREKQKAEHKRRRDARLARLQMLTRMQDNITEAIEKSNQDLEAIPALLERGRAEAEALRMKRRMYC